MSCGVDHGAMLCPKILPAKYETTFQDLPTGACFVTPPWPGCEEGEIHLKIEPLPGMVPGAVRLRDGKFVDFLFGSKVLAHRVDLQADTVGDLW